MDNCMCSHHVREPLILARRAGPVPATRCPRPSLQIKPKALEAYMPSSAVELTRAAERQSEQPDSVQPGQASARARRLLPPSFACHAGVPIGWVPRKARAAQMGSSSVKWGHRSELLRMRRQSGWNYDQLPREPRSDRLSPCNRPHARFCAAAPRSGGPRVLGAPADQPLGACRKTQPHAKAHREGPSGQRAMVDVRSELWRVAIRVEPSDAVGCVLRQVRPRWPRGIKAVCGLNPAPGSCATMAPCASPRPAAGTPTDPSPWPACASRRPANGPAWTRRRKCWRRCWLD